MRLLFILICVLAVSACALRDDDPHSLRYYAELHQVYIGTALNHLGLDSSSDPYSDKYCEVAGREFNLVTAESEMKMKTIWIAPDTLDFHLADEIAAFAVSHNQKMRGHCLLWYLSVPDWLRQGYENHTYTTNQIAILVQGYIDSVMTYFKTNWPGLIIAWDVVNEAIGPNDPTLGGTYGLRSPSEDFWIETLGTNYVARAFQWAYNADPDTPLYYNDYHAEFPNPKQAAILALLENLSNQGAPVSGLGLQCHFSLDYLNLQYPGITFTAQAISDTIDYYISRGWSVQVTELDIRINDDNHGITSAKLQSQADFYAEVLKASLLKSGCDAFVSWGFTDRLTWLDPSINPGSPALGWDEWPLYYDENIQIKPAYLSIKQVLRDW